LGHGYFAKAGKAAQPTANLVAILANFGNVMARSSLFLAIGRKMQSFLNYLKVAEVADYLGISTDTLRNWVNSEEIASVRHPHESLSIVPQVGSQTTEKTRKR
jgi:hypothetical protein